MRNRDTAARAGVEPELPSWFVPDRRLLRRGATREDVLTGPAILRVRGVFDSDHHLHGVVGYPVRTTPTVDHPARLQYRCRGRMDDGTRSYRGYLRDH